MVNEPSVFEPLKFYRLYNYNDRILKTSKSPSKNEEQIKYPTHSSAKQAPLPATKQPIPTTPSTDKVGSAQTEMNEVVNDILGFYFLHYLQNLFQATTTTQKTDTIHP